MGDNLGLRRCCCAVATVLEFYHLLCTSLRPSTHIYVRLANFLLHFFSLLCLPCLFLACPQGAAESFFPNFYRPQLMSLVQIVLQLALLHRLQVHSNHPNSFNLGLLLALPVFGVNTCILTCNVLIYFLTCSYYFIYAVIIVFLH